MAKSGSQIPKHDQCRRQFPLSCCVEKKNSVDEPLLVTCNFVSTTVNAYNYERRHHPPTNQREFNSRPNRLRSSLPLKSKAPSPLNYQKRGACAKNDFFFVPIKKIHSSFIPKPKIGSTNSETSNNIEYLSSFNHNRVTVLQRNQDNNGSGW